MASTTSKASLPAAAQHLRHSLHVMANAGRGFRRLHQHQLGVAAQRSLRSFQRQRLSIGSADDVRLAAKRLRQAGPAFAEFTGGQHQHAVARRGQIGDRSLHRPSAGTGQQNDIIFGADKRLELFQNALIQGAKFRSAMVQISGSHGKLRRWQQRSRAGSKETRLMEHASILEKKQGFCCAPIIGGLRSFLAKKWKGGGIG